MPAANAIRHLTQDDVLPRSSGRIQPVIYAPPVTNNGEMTTKEKILFSLLGAGCVTLAVVGVVKGIHYLNARKSDGKSLEVGSPESYAKQIQNVFENTSWWESYMDKLRPIYRAIKDQAEYDEVRKQYRLQNGGEELNTKLGEELKPSELNELLAIMAGKHPAGTPLTTAQYEAWAQRIYNGVNYRWGTDEEAIRAALIEIPTQAAMSNVMLAYYRMFGVQLMNDLLGDLEFWEVGDYLDIIKNKPLT